MFILKVAKISTTLAYEHLMSQKLSFTLSHRLVNTRLLTTTDHLVHSSVSNVFDYFQRTSPVQARPPVNITSSLLTIKMTHKNTTSKLIRCIFNNVSIPLHIK